MSPTLDNQLLAQENIYIAVDITCSLFVNCQIHIRLKFIVTLLKMFLNKTNRGLLQINIPTGLYFRSQNVLTVCCFANITGYFFIRETAILKFFLENTVRKNESKIQQKPETQSKSKCVYNAFLKGKG